MLSENIYAVYIITYSGNKLPCKIGGSIPPSNYIGSSSVAKIKAGYMGTVSSKKYKRLWNQELRDHPELFHIEIISYHDTRRDATWKELHLQKLFNVVNNPLFVNMALAQPNGYFGCREVGYMTYRDTVTGTYIIAHVLDDNVVSGRYVSPTLGVRRGDNLSNAGRQRISERMKTNNPMKQLKTNSGSFKMGNIPTITQERNENVRLSKLGPKNPMFGDPSASQHLNVRNCQCIHCGMVSTKGNISRWHNDNCKLRGSL